MKDKEAKILKLETKKHENSKIEDREMDLLNSFHQELLNIDAIIPEYIKSEIFLKS